MARQKNNFKPSKSRRSRKKNLKRELQNHIVLKKYN